MRNPLVLLSLCAVAAAARAQSVPCPSDPVVTGADGIQVHVNRCGGPSCSLCEDPSLYSSVSYPGRTPSSQVFCGQTTIWAPDPSGPEAPFIYHDNGWEVDSLGNCYGSRGGSKDRLASRNAALKAEIKGWIAEPPNASSAPGYTSDTPTGDPDQEKVFYVSLDVGWTPAPHVSGAGVQPINTLDMVNRYVPAFNLRPDRRNSMGGRHSQLERFGLGESFNPCQIREILLMGQSLPAYAWLGGNAFRGLPRKNPAPGEPAHGRAVCDLR